MSALVAQLFRSSPDYGYDICMLISMIAGGWLIGGRSQSDMCWWDIIGYRRSVNVAYGNVRVCLGKAGPVMWGVGCFHA